MVRSTLTVIEPRCDRRVPQRRSVAAAVGIVVSARDRLARDQFVGGEQRC